MRPCPEKQGVPGIRDAPDIRDAIVPSDRSRPENGSSDDGETVPPFLTTTAAGRGDIRTARWVAALSGGLFLCLAPFAGVPWLRIDAFIPAYESALAINDAITAVLIFGQFAILRRDALLLLASTYLFSSLMIVFHGVTFPGVLPPHTLGAQSQTTSWAYIFWHGGFPLGLLGYAFLKNRRDGRIPTERGAAAIILAVAATGAVVLTAALACTAGHDHLPPVLVDNRYTPTGHLSLIGTWSLSVMALAVLMWKRPHSTLDVWLMVVMSVWIFDIALSAVLNRGRFDIGWYSGRIYGLLAASFVLVMLLIENGRLYRRLAGAHDRERRRTRDLSQALDALHEKDEELRTVVDNVFDGIITIDSHGVILSANRAVESIFGHRRDDLVGRNVSVLMPAPIDEAHGGHLDAYRRTGTAGIIGTIREVEGVHSNGERIPLDLAVSAFNGRDGSCFVGTLRDIRERKRTIAELISARADAEQATRAKADFLAAMSHEIRTPMNGVIGMIEVLHQSSLKGYQVEMIDLIRESAFSLLTIIDDILDFSKIEAGRLDIEEAPLSIADQIDRVGGVLDHLAMHKGVTFTFFCDPRVPALVMGDAQRLGQILINLTNNAIKFSSGLDRPGRVSLRARPVSEDGDHVTIDFTITDNGIGMDGKTVEGLFIPFHQAGASTARRFGGTGLGLAISQNLAALMHGRISAVSIPGSGSTFTLRLPFAIAPEDGTAPRPEPRPQEVAGLYCLVIGGPSSLAADIALQLDHDGAMVATAPDLAFASTTCAPPPPSGTTPPVQVWIIDTEGEDPPPSEAVAAIAGAGTGQVVIGRGGNRQPRRQDGSRVTIDGNALTRRMLRRSVAIAAGRAAPGEEEERPGRQDSAFVQPPREEAIRRGSLVLVAEDNQTNRKVISHQLALLGYAADVVADGAAALERWKTGDYALLLTDLQMPGMDGYELTAAVRAHEQPGRAGARQFPIVALTANALKSEEDRCRMAGMDGYLSKPAKLADLQATLEHWLPPHGPGAGSGAPAPVDLSILTELVGDDPAVIRELLTDFLHTTAETADLIRTAAGTGQTGQAGTAAHKLKSSARSIGAQCLGDLCGRIERAAGAGSGDTLVALMAPFQAELTTVTSHLDRHLADLTGLASAGSPQASGEPSP